MLISNILTTLPERLNNLVMSWEMKNKNEQTLTDLIARLQEEYNKDKSVETDNVAFMTSSKPRCYKCNNVGHKEKFCKSTYDVRKDPKCNLCNRYGHKSDSCRRGGQKFSKKWCSVCRMNNHTKATCKRKDKPSGSSKN